MRNISLAKVTVGFFSSFSREHFNVIFCIDFFLNFRFCIVVFSIALTVPEEWHFDADHLPTRI